MAKRTVPRTTRDETHEEQRRGLTEAGKLLAEAMRQQELRSQHAPK